MASLADELLNDLENDDDDDVDDNDQDNDDHAQLARPGPSSYTNGNKNNNNNDDDEDDEDEQEEDVKMEGADDEPDDSAFLVPEGGVKPTDELDLHVVNEMKLAEVADVGKVAKVAKGRVLKDVLSKITYYKDHPDPNLASSDNDSAEYHLIVQANNLSVEIDNELLIVHKFIKDHYLPRFPELDSLVPQPLPFCRVILALGNPAPDQDLKGDLTGILTSGTIMAVTVTAATSKGEQLSEREWSTVEAAVEMMFVLEDAKRQILEYVESRISLLAPNISAIVGTQTATKILGIAGGLAGLNRIPASNIYLLGATKKANTGFSTASHSVDRQHTGFIYHSPIVQSVRQVDRMKAQRKVGAKVALASRVDSGSSRPDGGFGEEMVDKLHREFDRLAKPPPRKVVKALPKPEEGGKKNRRGGRRARKLKEQFQMTELRKLQNRVRFGEEEEETGAYDETRGLGMIGKESGRIRNTQAEARSQAKLTKAQKGRLASIRTSSTSSATSGLATSLAFTPVQGLELVDPSKLRNKVKEANDKWFAEGAFTHVRKEAGIGKGGLGSGASGK
ncbi:Nop domain-containing protein [Meredithblackwellia eburnea MCA 4105]